MLKQNKIKHHKQEKNPSYEFWKNFMETEL